MRILKDRQGKEFKFSSFDIPFEKESMTYTWPNLIEADLSFMNLEGADLYGANLAGADLSNSNLTNANLNQADLTLANLLSAKLVGADLRGVLFSKTNLILANLSGAKIEDNSKAFISKFKKTSEGIIVYKGIFNTEYSVPSYWEIKEGSYLEENVDFNRHIDCGHGVNFAYKEWIREHYPDSDVWECLIEWDDLPGVVIPFNTSGKARCNRLKLVKQLSDDEKWAMEES